jgi:hypothetical protein
MIPTMSLRLEDQLFVSPNPVVDQSLLAIRPAISFFVKGAVDGCFAPRSSNNILTTAYGTGGKQAKRVLRYNSIGSMVEQLTSLSGTRQSA